MIGKINTAPQSGNIASQSRQLPPLATFLGCTNTVMTRAGTRAAITLKAGDDVLTRGGFRPLLAVEIASYLSQPIALHPIAASQGKSLQADGEMLMRVAPDDTLPPRKGLPVFLRVSDLRGFSLNLKMQPRFALSVRLIFDALECIVTEMGMFLCPPSGMDEESWRSKIVLLDGEQARALYRAQMVRSMIAVR